MPQFSSAKELETASRRVFCDFATKNASFITFSLLDVLSFHEKLENLQKFNFYLQFLNEATSILISQKPAISADLQEKLLNFLKATLLSVNS